MQRRGLAFAGDGQLHLVLARQSERTFRPIAGIERTGDLHRIIVTQVPRKAVHAFVYGNSFRALDAIGPFRRLLTSFFSLLERCRMSLPEASRISIVTSSLGAVLK